MEIEDWVDTTGAGTEQVHRIAGEDDIVRNSYYTYVCESVESDRSFNALLFSTIVKLAGIAGGVAHAAVGTQVPSELLPRDLEEFFTDWLPHLLKEAPELIEKLKTCHELVQKFGDKAADRMLQGRYDLLKAMKATKVVVLITGNESPTCKPLATHKQTHDLQYLAKMR